MPDFRYKCYECKKEFTLHAVSKEFDAIEFDPACPWCENMLGAPVLMDPTEPLAAYQAGMAPMFLSRGLGGTRTAEEAKQMIDAAWRADPKPNGGQPA